MSYLYFGSRWGEDKNQIIEIFFKYNIVFAGLDSKEQIFNYKKYNIGTKIAVTDGFTIKAVGKTIEEFTSLDKLDIDFTDEELSKFQVGDWVLAAKVNLYKLDKKDWGWYDAAYKRVEPINSRKDIQEIIDILLKKYSGELAMKELKENCISLLKNNYNLILTGAPGTGKTYLAKQIATKIIFNDNNKEYTEALEENDDFKNQCQFVQFHPSYDYTDFVEGLRPIKDSNENIGFERKDGVFKEFCKRALKNLIDSKKKESELNYETIVKKYLIKFANEKCEEFNKNNKLILNGMRNKPVAPYINIYFDEEEEILLMTAQSVHRYTINGKIAQYVEWYKTYKEKKEDGTLSTASMEKAVGFPGRITYLCAFLHSFDIKYNSQIEKELKNSSDNKIEKVQKKNFVFIIDEINRGEISKILGELFFAVDPGYRGVKGKVLTQYSNLIDEESEKYFYIPENVYIIGTMNDIDRSVESMDFAMRRRFAWKEVNAKDTQESILKDLDDSIKQDAIDRMDALNNAISKIEGFNSSYHIGASYFLKLKNYYKSSSDDKETAFKSLWENHLKGLLFEYLRGMPDAESKLDELKKFIV